MAESEVAYIDVDQDIVSTQTVLYSDYAEPFDRDRELSLNRSDRERERNWVIVIGAEWIAGTSVLVGFAFLVVFAIRNL